MRDPRKLRAAAVEDLIDNPPPSIAEGWKARLLKSDRGKYLPVVANVLTALRHAPEWQGVLMFNQSSLSVVAKKAPPWDEARGTPFNWSDEDDVRLTNWVQHEGIMAGRETAGQAVQTIAREHAFHPIRDYLESLTWDGVQRIDDWLSLYLGADSSEYTRAVGARWLIQAVARIYKPGCKADAVMILEGPQGTLKSTSLRILGDPWFCDTLGGEMGTKDAALQICGVWIVELSELDSMNRSEVSRIKAFISCASDRFRPPYGKRPIEVPRECSFAGTTNQGAYLRDETGARRFWPVACGRINIVELRRDRDQLWAEARDRYRAGHRWWLDERYLVDAAAQEQEKRYEADPWDAPIAQWIDGKDSVAIEAILELCLDKPKATWTQADKNRIGRSLRALGWERYQQREGRNREWRYRPSPVSRVLI